MVCGILSLHKIGFYHNDIKPSNFLINHDGTVRLTDYGSARTGGTILNLTVGITDRYCLTETKIAGER
jgi:serine/threonine protein kinase